MSMERLWAGWRTDYVSDAAAGGSDGGGEGCVLCRVIAADEHLLATDEHTVAILNAFPYNNGHVLVLPRRHEADLVGLDDVEHLSLWGMVREAVEAVRGAYQPNGMNLGANMGRAAGAGLPDHLHVHVLPRWAGDTTFTTTVANTRVIPEALDQSADRLKAAWPDRSRR